MFFPALHALLVCASASAYNGRDADARLRASGASVATVAERVAADLRAAGVELAFGLPGGENVELLDALRRAGLLGRLKLPVLVVVFHDAALDLIRAAAGCH